MVILWYYLWPEDEEVEEVEGALDGDNSDIYDDRYRAAFGGWILDPSNRDLHYSDWRGEEVAENRLKATHNLVLSRELGAEDDGRKRATNTRTRRFRFAYLR